MQAKSLRKIEWDFSKVSILDEETSNDSYLRLKLSYDFSSLSSDVDALEICELSSFGKLLDDKWSDLIESCILI